MLYFCDCLSRRADKDLTVRKISDKCIVTGKENHMRINDLNRLTNSPSFRGGMEKFIQKAGEEAAKKPDALPKLLEAIGKTLQQIIR